MSEIVSKNPMERDTSRPISAHSTFVNGQPVAGTYRFGEITPHLGMEVVPDDHISIRSKHDLRAFTMDVPIMQDLRIKKDYFFVPLSAILPRNYEKFITSPNIGDDINPDLVGTSYNLDGLISYLNDELDNIVHDTDPISDDQSASLFLVRLLSWYVITDMVFGNAGLLAIFNCHSLSRSEAKKFDKFYQYVRSKISNLVSNEPLAVTIYTPDSGDDNVFSSFHEALEFIRHHVNISQIDFYSIPSDGETEGVDITIDLAEDLRVLLAESSSASSYIPSLQALGRRINVGRILSYQIACAHFFTNDKVDYIYSADLYRDYIFDLIDNAVGGLSSSSYSFEYNGINYLYDTLSSFMFSFVVNNCESATKLYNYLYGIFSIKQSLRHVDYFTGSRTSPLAVGDVGVRVNGGVVDVVDTIQTSWFAKFLNQVNRTGRRLAPYIKGLFPGTKIQPDWHEPLWLGHVEDKVISEETDNTSSDQFKNRNTSSKFMSNSERFALEFEVNQYYGFLIGVTYFDLERFYPETIERPFFHVDRFDMFNPYLQFNGDQEVYVQELYGSASGVDTFGYNSRYIEYKERVPYAFGGFIDDDYLSKFIFLADEDKSSYRDRADTRVSPSYIRSSPLELDRFYSSLTGLSLSEYFHFFIINRNHVKSVRPMVANPQLG